MKNITNIALRVSLSLFVLLSLSACVTTTIAPNYDKAIVDGLLSTNTELMEHFAATATGTSKDTFEKREKTYNHLIGSLDALTIQAKARPIPKNRISDRVNDLLTKRGVPRLENEDAPSATALEKISATLLKMRSTDKKQGITPFEAAAFKNQVIIYLDQAITYENLLER